MTGHINRQPDEWFAKHSAVSAEDFAKEPHRNKLNILVNRTNHHSYHLGQTRLSLKGVRIKLKESMTKFIELKIRRKTSENGVGQYREYWTSICKSAEQDQEYRGVELPEYQ